MPITCPLAILNLLDVFRAADIVGKGIVLILIAYSILVWSKLYTKWSGLNRANDDTRRFLYAFSRDAHPLRVFLSHDKFIHSPLYTVYEAGCRALMDEVTPGGVEPDGLFKANSDVFNRRLGATEIEAVVKSIDRRVLEQALEIQEHMGFLATAINLAPFLGLLGTVWGVMGSFYGMGASSGTLSLTEVAPGVASALLGTVAGLIVAIPSSFGYNGLNEKIRTLMVKLDNFSGEFCVELKRHYAPVG